MKKILCLTLALILIMCAFAACGNETEPSGTLSGVVLETSSDNVTDEPNSDDDAPEGFLMYKNDEITFAYPSDWTQNGIAASNADGTKSITVTSQEKTTFYAGLDTQRYVQQVRNDFQTEGKKLVTASVAQKNKDGLNITYITQTFSVEGMEGELYQNIYAFDTEDKTYVLTLTQPNGFEVDKTLSDTVFDTIKVK